MCSTRRYGATVARLRRIFFYFSLHLRGRACVGGFSLTLYRIVLPTLASIPIGLLRRVADMVCFNGPTGGQEIIPVDHYSCTSSPEQKRLKKQLKKASCTFL